MGKKKKLPEVGSEQERALVESFLSEIKRLGYRRECPELSDTWCLKFLRVANFDQTKAITGFKRHCEWRITLNTGMLLKRRLPKEESLWLYWPHYYVGRTVDGSPVVYMKMGGFDVAGMMDKFEMSIQDILLYHVKQQEFLRELAEEATRQEGKTQQSTVYILDLHDASMRKHLSTVAREFFQKLVETDSKNYPETLNRCILINSSRIFPVIWSFVKGFLDPRTRDRIEVYGPGSPDDDKGWADKIRGILHSTATNGEELPDCFNPDLPVSLPPDGRLPSENPLWSVMGYSGPADHSRSAGSVRSRHSARKDGHRETREERRERRAARKRAQQAGEAGTEMEMLERMSEKSERVSVAHDAYDAGRDEDEQGPELDLNKLGKKQLALNALQACLEAEGLTGAVTVKQNPQWQCLHCKQQFPLIDMLDLQHHEMMCAKRVAMLASDGNVLPSVSSTFLQRTMLRFDRDDDMRGDDLYRSAYQESDTAPLLRAYHSKFVANEFLHQCCSLQ